MRPMLNVAIQAVRQAGNFIIKQYDILNTQNTKIIQHEHDLLIKFNKTINQLISNTIKKYYPLHTIILKNNYHKITKKHEIQWIINPIDSQINFIKHFPYFASSIAVQVKGQTEISVIYDPIHNDLFSAIRGQGTQLNGYRIHNQSTETLLRNHTLVTYFPYSNIQHNNIPKNIFNKLHTMKKHIDIRYSGAVTLDLAYVAIGRIDALFFTKNLETYNFASGALLIREAGKLIFDLNDKNFRIQKNMKIAGNPKLMNIIIKEPS